MTGFRVFAIIVFKISITTAQSNKDFLFTTETNHLEINSDCKTSANKPGKCLRAVECPPEKLSFNEKDICFFERTNVQPIVCCENYRIAIEYCDYNIVGGGAFAGGIAAKQFENPQMAAIGWRSKDNSIMWNCGGSLISHNFILTAAHCAYNRGQPAAVARVGDLNLLVEGDADSQDFDISEIIVHPQYKRELVYHDIALMKISPNATFTRSVQPACLWYEFHIPYTNLIGMGYGTDAFAGRKRNELYQGDLQVVSNENCSLDFGAHFSQIPQGIIESQICAKNPRGKVDTCQGDSGGPLIYKNFGERYLVGITSFGESCGGPTAGVYTRVSSYIDWIESVVWPNGTIIS